MITNSSKIKWLANKSDNGLDNDTKESIVQRADIENLEYIEAEPIQQKQNELNSLPNTLID